MPQKFGKYRSRRKKAKKGAGLMHNIGSAVNEVGKFVESSGKDVANVAAEAAPLLGQAMSHIGSTIDDEAGIGKAMQRVGDWTAKSSKDIIKEVGKASPAIGKAGQWVGQQMMASDVSEGGSLLNTLSFQHGKHASQVLDRLDDYHFGAIQSAARYMSGHEHVHGSHPILHHRHTRSVPTKHFHQILNSTKGQLSAALHNSKHDMLHKAFTSTLHSAHVGGGVELDHREHLGGGLFDNLGAAIGQFNKIDFNDPVSGWENTMKGMGELSQAGFDQAAQFVPSSMKDLTKGAGQVLKTVDYALGDAGRMIEKTL